MSQFLPYSGQNLSSLFIRPNQFVSVLLILLFNTIIPKTIAQTKVWDKAFEGSISNEFTSMIATADGGYLVASSDSSSIQFNKIDKEGKHVWVKSVVSNGRMETFVATNDGGYVVGGNLNQDYWVIRIDQSWNIVWNKSFGGDSTDNLTSLVANLDGSFLLGGTSYSKKSKDKIQNLKGISDYWVVKIDATGKKIWDKSYGGVTSIAVDVKVDPWDELIYDTITTGESYLNSIVATPEGGYLLGGNSSSFAGGDNTSGQQGVTDYPEWHGWYTWVIKIDRNGNKVWDKTYGSTSYMPSLKAMIASLDGGFLLGCTEYYDSGPADYGNYFIAHKVNSSGEEEWNSIYGNIGSFGEDLSSLLATKDGGFLIGGSSSNDKIFNPDKSEDSRGGSDYWIIKVNSGGDRMWDKTIGGEEFDYLSFLLPTTDGGYLVVGNSASGISGDKTVEGGFWIVKVKEDNPFGWNLRYGSWGNEGFTTILKTADGGFLSGGYTNSGFGGDKTQNSQGGNDYWLVKSDKNGKNLWDKRYGGTGDDYLNRIISTNDGGYLLAGSSLSGKSGNKTQASRGDRDYWIVKVNNAGIYQWDKSFGGKGYDELKKVMQLSTGEFILAGYSNSPVGGDKNQSSQGGTDFWLVKVSATGTKIWDKRYGGSLNEVLSGIVETADKGYLLSGSSLSGKSGDKSQLSRGSSDFWLIRIDKNGKKLWDKTYGGSGKDEGYSLGRNANEFFISGQSDSPAGGDKTRGTQGGLDFWLLKLNSSGGKIWDKRYGGSKDDELRASIQTSDGGYLLAGKSFSDKSGNKSQNSQGSSDYWIVKTDKDGMYQWDKRFGGNGVEDLRAVTQTADGGLLLAGKSDSDVSGDRTQPSQGGTDFWLVKVGPDTKPIVAIKEAVKVEEDSVIKASQVNLTAYPNPFSDKLTVNFTLPETQETTLKVYDSQGREITTLFNGEAQTNQTYQLEWQAGNKTEGLYILQLRTPLNHQSVKLLLTR